MAQEDGAVRIITAFDAAGFDKGVVRMEKAMSSLGSRIEKLGATIDRAFNSYVKTLQSAGAAMRPIEASTDAVAEKTERLGGAADSAAESYGRVAQEAGKAKAALDTLYQKRDEMKLGDAKLTDAGGISGLKVPQGVKDVGAYVQDAQNLLVEIQAAEKALADLEAKRDALKDGAIFSTGETAQAGEYAGKVQQIGESFSETSDSAKTAAADIEESTQDIAKSVGAEINGIITQLNTFNKDFESAQSGNLAADSFLLEGWLDGYEKAVNRLSSLRDSLTSQSKDEDLQYSEAEISGYTQRLYELEEQARASQEEIRNFAKQAGISLNISSGTPPVIADLETGIQSAEAALQDYQSAASGMTEEGALYSEWLDISEKIENAAAEAEQLQANLDELSESGDIDQTQYDELSERLTALIGDYSELRDTVEESTQGAKPQYLRDWEQMSTLSGMVSEGFERIRNSALTAAQAVQHPIQALDRGLALVAQTALRAGAALAQMARTSIINALRLLGQSASEAARNITKLTAAAVSGGIKRLGAWLSSAAKSMTLFGRSARKNNNVLKKSFSTILKYGLGVRSFYFLFRKIRQAIGEGYQNLARYSDTLNQSISGVISSFKKFENQFAASFEPLVNTIAPAITNLINSLTEGTYRVGEFIAALSGQKTVTKAKEVQEDFAASLDKTKKAAKAAERQLADFDKLNILKKQGDEGTKPEDMFETVSVEDEAKDFADAVKDAWVHVDLSGIGEIVGGKIKVALDKIPWPDIKQGAENMGKRLATFLNGLIKVPDLGKSLGKTLAEAVNTAFSFLDGFAWEFHWDDLGNAIMDAVETACDNLDWGRINHALQGLATGLADLLNTIFSRVEVWEKVGWTLGKALNAAVNAGITFLERFDFVKAAIAITAGLNAMIDEIEWDKIGRLFADAFGGVLQFLYTAITEFHWADFGDDIATMVNEFVDVMLERIAGIEWSEVGAKIAEGVNHAVVGIEWDDFGALVGQLLGGALLAAATFIRDLDYGEIVQAIQDFFSSAIQEIDFYDLLTVWGVATLIVALQKVINKHPVLTFLVGAVLALGPELGNAIHKMVSDIPWEEVGANFAESFNGIISRIDEAITSVDWAGETATIMTGLNSFLAGIEWASLGQTLTDAVIALLAVINTALYDFDWKGLGADIATLIENIDAVEILSGAARLASNFVTGLLDLINGFLETADWTEFPGTILNSILGIVTNIEWGRIAGQIIELLLNAILVIIQLAWGIGEAIAEWILNGIDAVKNYFQEAGENVANGILEGLGKIWEGIKSWIKEHIFRPFISAWEHIWQIGSPSKVMEEQGGFIISGLLGGISAAWGGIIDFFSGALDGLKSTLGGAWDTISGAASEAWNGISTALGGIVGGIVETVSGAWENVKTATGDKWREVTTALGTTWESVKTEAGDKWNAVKETVSSAWGAISRDADGALKDIAKGTSDKWNEVKTNASKVWGDIRTEIPKKAEEIKTGVVSKVRELASQALPFWRQTHTDAQREWKQTETDITQSANNVKTRIVSAFQSLQGTLSGVWGSIRSAASGAMSSISATVSSMASSISSRVSSIRSTVSNMTSSASDALSRVADKMDNLTRKTANSISVGGLASGGFVTDSGRISWWDSVRKYASGTSRAAGSLFVAGEAGPEIVGHVNGRTEVLNQSQIASAIYSAVLSAMSEAVQTFGGFLSQQMASNTNALITAMGQIQAPREIAAPQDTALTERLAALSAVPYQVPAYATGTVMPYEVVAEIRRQTSEITSAIYSEGEEIIQAVVSAITNHGLSITNAIGKIPVNQGQSYSPDDITRYAVDGINRLTRMNGRSPLQS